MADETTITNDSENSTTETSTTTPNADNSSTTTPHEDETIDLGKGGEEAGVDDVEPKDDDKEDTRSDEEKAADEARAALFGAPEGDAGYEIEGLPEGMTIDAEALEDATPVFKELGLSNVGASKVAAVYAEKVLPRVVETAKTQFEDNLKAGIDAQRTEWQGATVKAVKGETELKTATGDTISFDGAGMKQVSQAAARAIDRLAPAGFREFLEETGLGVHPAMVAFAYRAGQLVAEDTDAGGGSGGGDQKPTRTQKYYGR